MIFFSNELIAIAKILLGKFECAAARRADESSGRRIDVWLERFLKNAASTIFMTWHDREFMNRIVTRIVEIEAGEIVMRGSGDLQNEPRQSDEVELVAEERHRRPVNLKHFSSRSSEA